MDSDDDILDVLDCLPSTVAARKTKMQPSKQRVMKSSNSVDVVRTNSLENLMEEFSVSSNDKTKNRVDNVNPKFEEHTKTKLMDSV